MLKVMVKQHVFQGNMKNFEMEGDDLVIRFEFGPEKTIDLTLPTFPSSMLDTMKYQGLAKLKNSTIDLNKGMITLNDSIDTTPRKKVTLERRPGVTTIKGGLVGK